VPLTTAPTEPQETAYLAADGLVAPLRAELSGVREVLDRLVIAAGGPQPAAWALNIWHAPRRIPIASIGEAAKALRAMQRNWALYSFARHRRAALIQAKLPVIRQKKLAFPAATPGAPLGSWTLLQPDLLYAAPNCSNPFPNGEPQFAEDRTGPPNRAYLKLWEFFALEGVRPAPGEHCVDLGASPGGWTWVLLELGARVTAIDKAPLAPQIAARPGLAVVRESAFGVAPATLGRVDWLFADIACYPDRLLRLVRAWLAAPHPPTIVATIKFQGETDLAAQRAFAGLQGARLRHLFHNKHELTLFVPGRPDHRR
jgi:23S rRNA (cytidine2498-2'-O)-methyltransferase